MKWTHFFFLIGILFILSCTKTETIPMEVNYKEGIHELTLNFDEKYFPQKVYQNSPLSFSFTIHNEAGYDLYNVVIHLLGFDQKYIELTSNEQRFDTLEGRSIYNPVGEEEFLLFEGAVKELLPGMESLPQNFFVNAKYTSRLEFTPTVCVNPSLHQVYDAGCVLPTAPITFNGQGAPLAVQSMDQITRSGFSPETELRITLQNKGKGKVKRVALRQSRFGNTNLECQFRDAENPRVVIVKDYTKPLELVCTQKLEDQRSYTTSLYLELEYDYEITLSRSLEIQR